MGDWAERGFPLSSIQPDALRKHTVHLSGLVPEHPESIDRHSERPARMGAQLQEGDGLQEAQK